MALGVDRVAAKRTADPQAASAMEDTYVGQVLRRGARCISAHGSAQGLQTAAAALALQLKGETDGARKLLDALGPTDERLAMNLMAAFTGAVVYAAAQLEISPEEFCEQLATFGASGATDSAQS